MTRWLVTGAGGQLATAFADLLDGDESATVVFMREEETDLRDPDAVLRAVRAAAPDVVLHTAAYTAVDAAESDEATALAVNEGGTANLVAALGHLAARADADHHTERAPDAGVPLLVSFSSDYVFDGRKGRPYVESDEPCPLSAYGRSKLAQERATLAWPAGIVVRTAWLYSPTGANFVKTIARLARERVAQARERAGGESLGIANVSPQPTPLRVVDDQVGSPTYAPHLAAGVLELLVRGPAPGIYHIAGSGACSWLELAREIVTRAGLAVEVLPQTTEELGRPAPRPAYSALVSERGAPVLPPWHDGVAACLAALDAPESVAARPPSTVDLRERP
jgi:dTDP-4-dehydrorhamnose reductase